MTALKSLAKALTYLQGVGKAVDPELGAQLVAEHLAKSGYSVQPIGAPILHDLTPETLKRVRVALGIRQTRLAAEASLSAAVICMTELGRSQTRVTTLEAIGDALVRLGARRPE